MKVLKLGVSVAAIALAVAVGGGLLAPALFAPRQDVAVNAADPVLIEQGRAVAQASDCVACHTAADGKLFAGGLAMRTPLGVITSTNITPDKRDGIGGYDYADFERAVRHGVRKDGAPLYPAMPYVSFAVLTDADTQALYAYFMSAVAPVAQPNQPPAIPWPQNMRWPLAWWQMLFASPRDFTAAPGAAPEVARGAYLVEGPGHCGACHTPARRGPPGSRPQGRPRRRIFIRFGAGGMVRQKPAPGGQGAGRLDPRGDRGFPENRTQCAHGGVRQHGRRGRAKRPASERSRRLGGRRLSGQPARATRPCRLGAQGGRRHHGQALRERRQDPRRARLCRQLRALPSHGRAGDAAAVPGAGRQCGGDDGQSQLADPAHARGRRDGQDPGGPEPSRPCPNWGGWTTAPSRTFSASSARAGATRQRRSPRRRSPPCGT